VTARWFNTQQPGVIYRLDRPQVGLLAGWGQYPLVVAQALRRQGRRVIGVGVREHTDPQLAAHCDHFRWVGLGQIGAVIQFYRQHGVRAATMAGKIHKVRLFEPWFWWKLWPDWRTLKVAWRVFLRDRCDDTILSTILEEFARDGIDFLPATDFAPELLVKLGLLTGRGPNSAQRRDIEFGWKMAKEMGRLDIGQSVAVKDRAVLAVEAIEGTDACIQRAGSLCESGGFTVVKVAKPQQDMRFDVPTIGLGTLEMIHAAGGRVLAVEAERTILLDEAAVVRYADKHGLVIVALKADEKGALLSVP